MARDMPVQDLRQAHLDHLPDEQGHIVDPLCDDDQVTFPKELYGLRLSCILMVCYPLLTIFPLQLEDNNLMALAKMPSTPLSEPSEN
jgi:hypothetical protein